MKILMIYPEFPETFWSFKHALKFIHKEAYVPPLGLLTVAAMLPDSYELRLVDLNVQPLRPGDLAWADCVFTSAMHVQQDSVRQVIGRCKAAGLPVVAGGPLFTHGHESFPEVDHFVLGEAEHAIRDFLADFERGQARHVYQHEGTVDLADSPIPRFDLVDMRRYASMAVQYSRGCPFDCEFCDVTYLFGRKTRVKRPQQIVAELDRLQELGWRGPVFFVDDNLIGSVRHAKTELLPALVAWQKRSGPIAFCSQVSINVADDPELIDLMVHAGIHTVFVGIETPDDATLAACHKVQNTGRNLLADVHRLQSCGIQVQGGFIVGFDDESPSVFHNQVSFIQSSGIVSAMIGVLQAIHGTKLYQRLKSESRLRSEVTGDNVIDTTNFVTTMDAQTLSQGYAYVMRSLYAPKAYYARLRVFLKNYKAPKVRQRLSFQQVRAFGHSLIQLGVLRRERLQYWRLLLWTLLHRPGLFGTAVTLAIVGYHYRRICQLYFGDRLALPEGPAGPA